MTTHNNSIQVKKKENYHTVPKNLLYYYKHVQKESNRFFGLQGEHSFQNASLMSRAPPGSAGRTLIIY